MHTVIKKISRFLILNAVFFLPKEKKIRVERWLRGKEEFRKLQLADAVIVSFGKSGRTWLRVLLSRFYQLQHGLSERHLIGFDNLHRKNNAIPKLFFTHDNYIKDYTGHRDNKADFYASNVVLLARNPLDVAVSQFFQWKYRMRAGKKALNKYPEHGSNIDIFDFVMAKDSGLTAVIDYLNAWANEADLINNLLIVRYEDLRSDTGDTLDKIVNFIGTPGSRQDIVDAVKFASIDNMRKMEQKRTFWLSGSRMVAKDKNDPNTYKVRKAKVGGYKDYFDDAQLQILHKIVADQLHPMFNYDPAAAQEIQALSA
ncbi:MAG: sulfotransferase domain-containing protein [Pseudomonadales bacterium]